MVDETGRTRRDWQRAIWTPNEWDRDELGRAVRRLWIQWAEQQPDPKPAWLLPWEHLREPDREADRIIGEGIARLAVESFLLHTFEHEDTITRGPL